MAVDGRADQPARPDLPEPAVGSAVHPGAGGQSRRRRAMGSRVATAGTDSDRTSSDRQDVPTAASGQEPKRSDLAHPAGGRPNRLPVAGGTDSSHDRRPVTASSVRASSSRERPVAYNARPPSPPAADPVSLPATARRSPRMSRSRPQHPGRDRQRREGPVQHQFALAVSALAEDPTAAVRSRSVFRQHRSTPPDRVSSDRRTAMATIDSTRTRSRTRPTISAVTCPPRSDRRLGQTFSPAAMQLGARPAQLRFCLRRIATGGPGPLVGRARRRDIDVLAEFGVLGQDRDALLGDRQETTVDGDGLHRAVRLGDPGGETLAQLGEQRRMARASRRCPRRRSGHHHLRRGRTRSVARRRPVRPAFQPCGCASSRVVSPLGRGSESNRRRRRTLRHPCRTRTAPSGGE